jgi:hypothetical protein
MEVKLHASAPSPLAPTAQEEAIAIFQIASHDTQGLSCHLNECNQNYFTNDTSKNTFFILLRLMCDTLVKPSIYVNHICHPKLINTSCKLHECNRTISSLPVEGTIVYCYYGHSCVMNSLIFLLTHQMIHITYRFIIPSA